MNSFCPTYCDGTASRDCTTNIYVSEVECCLIYLNSRSYDPNVKNKNSVFIYCTPEKLHFFLLRQDLCMYNLKERFIKGEGAKIFFGLIPPPAKLHFTGTESDGF